MAVIIILRVMISQGYTYFKTHQIIHFKYAQYIVMSVIPLSNLENKQKKLCHGMCFYRRIYFSCPPPKIYILEELVFSSYISFLTLHSPASPRQCGSHSKLPSKLFR